MKTFKIVVEFYNGEGVVHLKAANQFDAVRVYCQCFESSKQAIKIKSVEETKLKPSKSVLNYYTWLYYVKLQKV